MANPPITLEKLGISDTDKTSPGFIDALSEIGEYKAKMPRNKETHEARGEYQTHRYDMISLSVPYGKNFLESLLEPRLWKGTEREALALIRLLPDNINDRIDSSIKIHFEKTAASEGAENVAELRAAGTRKGKGKAPE